MLRRFLCHIGVLLVMSYILSADGFPTQIRLNQVGYRPDSTKIALINMEGADFFEIWAEGKVILKGPLGPEKWWQDAEEFVRWADFSALKMEGEYEIRVGAEVCEGFRIVKAPLQEVAHGSLKSFYYQRCSQELKPSHAGRWSRALGHPDTKVLLHPSTGHSSGHIASPGGWYDAGDYGKYVIPGAYAAARLMHLYERYPSSYPDGRLNIPESDNGMSDILDEIKYECDWLKTMQDEKTGEVYHKVTTKRFARKLMPHEAKKSRWVIGRSAASTFDFAAVMAMAYRVYLKIHPTYAKDCLARAERAWRWAMSHPNVHFKNPSDIHTGEYGRRNVEGERFWAATELFLATEASEYGSEVERYFKRVQIQYGASWASVGLNGYLSILTYPERVGEGVYEEVKRRWMMEADRSSQRIMISAARLPKINYHWGSNGSIAFKGLILAEAFRLSKDVSYLLASEDVSDYLLGRNGVGLCYVTGYGHRSPMNIHHRPSMADKIEAPVPGLLVGGANGGQQDKRGVQYRSTAPAKSYEDHKSSYASNEVTVYWNADAVYLFTALHEERSLASR
jgi:endoglucanase